ncbi:MAG: hypothetical protein SAK29_18280 [Scytonema sp. PMC 1069.18]|nr:hypothetical protein [Scytonema sp. PMC 1069.18]MEC4887692.1 hypothetical protein [Scytonema sp. PMC 1070.18]
MNQPRDLTPKEQKVVEAFDAARPGLGELAAQNIRNESSGWADQIAATDESELVVTEGTASNSFIYKRIG